ncbi:MAG TPA: NPCBM/NEW2 domain-containing protein, partial [Gemmataceae bacterium]
LRRPDLPLPPPPGGPHLLLGAGDRIAGEVRQSDGSFLLFRPQAAAGDEPWRVPVPAVSVAWLARPSPRLARAPAWRDWLRGPRRRDALLLTNGDLLRGTFVAIDPPQHPREGEGRPGKVRFLAEPLAGAGGEAREVTLDRAGVAAVAFNTSLMRTRPPRGRYALLTLDDGSRVSARSVQSDGHRLRAETPFGVSFAAPLERLAGLTVLGGKAVYLSDLTPARERQTPYFRLARPWQRDLSARGEPITLRDPKRGPQTFAKGVGMHGRAELTFALGGRYRRFEALVGLQDATDPARRAGRARARVRVDGKPFPEEGPLELSHAGGPRRLRIDVTGARELTLEVDFGPGGGAGDAVNWAEARLIAP